MRRGAASERASRGARRVLLLLGCAVGFSGIDLHLSLPSAAADEPQTGARLPPLELRIDPNDVDLERGQLTATLSRPAAKLSVKVLDATGAVLAELEQTFEGARAGAPLVVRWQPPSSPVARIEVFGHDTSGYFKGIAITPWSFEVPHEDVVFDTDSATIRPDQEQKLAASLRTIDNELQRARRLGTVTLFILAHTDTVGTAAYNQALSTRRALAIARWFRAHGLKIAMAYDGMGESMPKLKTADETDEPRNRRVDYMLGVEPPRFKQSRTSPAWKKI
jgi:outer membrane protein OmpA-like peptidoglycan-associated protein